MGATNGCESTQGTQCGNPKGYIGRSLVGYAQYHQHPVNIAIHVVFVPAIMFATLTLLAYLPSIQIFKEGNAPEGFPSWLGRSLDIGAGSLIFLLYAGLYSSWDPVAGLSWSAITGLPLLTLANYFQSEVEMAWAWAVGLEVLSWYMQIHPGHLIFEKRRPALVDSVVQAFVTAPLFVWLDVLFMLGYRPELKAAVKAQVSEANLRKTVMQTAARTKAA